MNILQTSCHDPDGRITGIMSLCIIDRLEVVDINHLDCKRNILCACCLKPFISYFAEISPVGNAAERVRIRKVSQNLILTNGITQCISCFNIVNHGFTGCLICNSCIFPQQLQIMQEAVSLAACLFKSNNLLQGRNNIPGHAFFIQ